MKHTIIYFDLLSIEIYMKQLSRSVTKSWYF
jgi:hypothetical protein